MATPKNDSYRTNVTFLLVFIPVMLGVTKRASLADTKTAVKTLVDTYKFSDVIAPPEAESAIADMKRVLDDSKDNYLAFRIKYRIGVIYFRAGKTVNSEDEFRNIAEDPKCPVTIRACSLNMIGQISRLRGENEQALNAFNKLIDVLKQLISSDKEHASNFAMTKLWCSSVLSKAEIYELQRNYAAGINEYSRLLGLLSQTKDSGMFGRYTPLANDRMSQLFLRQGDTDKYMKLAKVLTKTYPKYPRAPIVGLELACVEFLNSVSANTEFTSGSFTAPARMIALIKSSNETIPVQNIVNKLQRLCSEYQDIEGSNLLQYHYAWLLDALGDKDKAAEIFARISSNNGVNSRDEPGGTAVAKSIQDYATIQYAIMAGEKTDYKDALRALSGLRTHPSKSHISELAESITKGIETLKREVPSNDNKGR